VTTELERIKILEDKIAHVVEHVTKLAGENERLRQQVKDLRAEKKDADEMAKRLAALDENVKRYENERETIKGKIEVLITQIDKLGL
jgi:predicted  nucleic acid-binding Zn-ribbon protein